MATKFIGAEPVSQADVQATYAENLSSNPNAKVLRFVGVEPVDAKNFQTQMAASYTNPVLGFVGSEPVDLKAAKAIVNP